MGAYIFRNNLTLSQVGRAMARYAFEQLGLRKYAVLYPQRASGQIQAAAFWQEIERLGGQIVGAEAYSPSTTDFTDEAKKLVGRFHLIHRPLWSQLYRQISHVSSALERNRLYKKLVNQFLPVTDFDALFIPVEIYNQVAMITSAIAQQDVEVKLHYRYWERQREELYQRRNRPIKFIQLLGTNVWYNEQLFKLEPRNVIGSIFCLRYFPQSNRKIVKQFVNMYKKSYPEQTQGQDPIHVSAYTYDSMQMLLHIVHDKNPPKTREEFRFRLLQIKNFAGVTGDMSVQPDGEILAPIKYLIADRKQFFRLHYVSKDLIR
jgi:ABC-type branched-subunit amino acid transport system substrate-binding protein